jgi:hypothetical protein
MNCILPSVIHFHICHIILLTVCTLLCCSKPFETDIIFVCFSFLGHKTGRNIYPEDGGSLFLRNVSVVGILYRLQWNTKSEINYITLYRQCDVLLEVSVHIALCCENVADVSMETTVSTFSKLHRHMATLCYTHCTHAIHFRHWYNSRTLATDYWGMLRTHVVSWGGNTGRTGLYLQ